MVESILNKEQKELRKETWIKCWNWKYYSNIIKLHNNNDLSIFQKQIKKKITIESSVIKICDTAAFEDPFVGG